MRAPALALVAVFAAGLWSAPALLQEKGGDDRTGPYDIAPNWPQPLALAKPGYMWGSTGGVFAESPNRIFIANRGELKLPERVPPGFTGAWGFFNEQATTPTPEFRNCIVIVDGNGKALDAWTQWDHLFEDGRGPHSVLISPYDPEHHVWVVDDIHHQIFKFTNDGKKLLMTLGQRDEAGNDDKHFKRPTDIAWLPDGTFFVSDGYGNTRVAKFDKNGKFLMTWGTRGTANSQFNTPHSITIDRNRRVYVADRANNRIQVFDENGKYLDQFPNITQPYNIRISEDQFLWVFSGPLDKFMKYDLNGRLLYAWGTHGTAPGLFWAVHEFSADTDGNFYTAEVFGGRAQKFRPRAGADPLHVYRPQPLLPKSATEAPASAAAPPVAATAQAGGNLSGSYKFEKAEPLPGRGGGAGGAGGRGGAPAAPDESAFGALTQALTIAQTSSQITVQSGPRKATYTLDGKTTVVPPGDVNGFKTWAHWDGGALHLHYKQGMNWGRDILTLSGATLSVTRDIESGGGSTTRTIAYAKGS